MVRIYPRRMTLGFTVNPMNAWSFDTVQQQKDAIKSISGLNILHGTLGLGHERRMSIEPEVARMNPS